MLSANFNAGRIVIVLIAKVAAAGCCAGHVSFWFFTQVSFFRRYIHEVNTVNTFGRPPLTPHMLSMFTVISDETRKYFAIRVSTGYYRVGHSSFLYYELLLLLMQVLSDFQNLIYVCSIKPCTHILLKYLYLSPFHRRPHVFVVVNFQSTWYFILIPCLYKYWGGFCSVFSEIQYLFQLTAIQRELKDYKLLSSKLQKDCTDITQHVSSWSKQQRLVTCDCGF